MNIFINKKVISSLSRLHKKSISHNNEDENGHIGWLIWKKYETAGTKQHISPNDEVKNTGTQRIKAFIKLISIEKLFKECLLNRFKKK